MSDSCTICSILSNLLGYSWRLYKLPIYVWIQLSLELYEQNVNFVHNSSSCFRKIFFFAIVAFQKVLITFTKLQKKIVFLIRLFIRKVVGYECCWLGITCCHR